MITADLISRIALFTKLPEAERASLAARAADIQLRQDEWLVVEGQTPSFYGSRCRCSVASASSARSQARSAANPSRTSPQWGLRPSR